MDAELHVDSDPSLPSKAETTPRARKPSKAVRAGIVVPPSRVRAKLRASDGTLRLEKDVEIWLAAAVESVLREALQKCGEEASRNLTSRGKPYKRARLVEANLDWLGRQPEFESLVQTLRASPGSNDRALLPPEQVGSSASSSGDASVRESTESPRAKWQYEDNGWRDYDAEASAEVERCYQTYLACPGQFDVRSVKSGTWHYQVDFPQMIQTNIRHENHTRRAIRRVTL